MNTIKVLWTLVALTLLIAFVPYVANQIRYLGYVQGCYDSAVKITNGLQEQGVEAHLDSNAVEWCQQNWKEIK